MRSCGASREGSVQIERDQIQSFVYRSRPKMSGRYLLLDVKDPQAARGWLAARLSRSEIGTAAPDQGSSFVNVAFTSPGLAEFGLEPWEIASFGHEFREGMVEDHRSRALGDVGGSAPAHWSWGGPGRRGHVLLLVFAQEGDQERFEGEQCAALDEAFEIVHDMPGLSVQDFEHFGFRDGISQPILEGTHRARDYPDQVVRTGEFILGYLNEHDRLPPSPCVPTDRDPRRRLADAKDGGGRDFGRNGSYLVVRQLQQDVASFWRYVEEQSGGDVDAERALAAKLVGRWEDGTPLTLEPDSPPPRARRRPMEDLLAENGFGFVGEDAHGLRCPVGSHVRRTNPRDALALGRPSNSLSVSRRHRILRRGRSYGSSVPWERRKAADDDERGLMFACLNADIGRQFEFVQQTWADSPSFGGLHDERDPLIGSHDEERGGTMTVPQCPVRRKLFGIPRFVTVRGGGYFFVPGLGALHFLADRQGAGSRAPRRAEDV